MNTETIESGGKQDGLRAVARNSQNVEVPLPVVDAISVISGELFALADRLKVDVVRFRNDKGYCRECQRQLEAIEILTDFIVGAEL